MSEYIKFEIEDNIGLLTFDKPDSGANVFDETTLNELKAHLEQIEQNGDLKGLILYSAKNSIFIAGADISQFSAITDEEQARKVIGYGQELFRRIEKLSIPTVAAIHGAALGGGCEITLACDYRLASADKSTRIGLPEINLGILPGWGGCYRLPKIVGLPKAMDIILAGKALKPKPALRCGLVDLLAPKERLLKFARDYVAKGKAAPKKLWKTNNPLVSKIASKKATASINKKTRGHYPAPLKALEVILKGLTANYEEAMKAEEDSFAELVNTEVSRNLVRIFFLQERAKKLTLVDASEAPAAIDRIAVIGAGTMGAGIAQWSSARGKSVFLKDISPDALNNGMREISRTYATAVKRYVFTRTEAQQGMDRITTVHEDVSLKRMDLIVEAATENLELKKKIFSRLDQLSAENTLLATNTSALSINEIANAAKDPGKVVGIHFFNPVSKMPLVEIVVGERTRPENAERALKYVQRIGKMPVVVKDSPGFLVNRILMPYLIEAGHLFDNGAAIEKLDTAMLDFGMPMGPCRLIDEIGVDVAHHVAEFFAGVFGARMPLPQLLSRMVEKGYLGRKNGKGFYIYGKNKKEPKVNEELSELTESQKFAVLENDVLQQRMVMLMLNEAAMCLEEEVVKSPEDVDFGMIMGTGFAPFRGGPCRYADSLGIKQVEEMLVGFSASEKQRFEPCNLLKKMGTEGKSFYQ